MIRTIFITGATAGFGQATARRFVKSGWHVIGTGRRRERLDALQREFGEAFHGVSFDITKEDDVLRSIADLPPDFSRVDVLLNNAGLALGTVPVPQTKLSDWKTMIDTNVTGLVTLTHHLLPALINRMGAIINISSVAAHYPYAGGNVYAATKAFLRQFSLGLRADLHGKGVRVTSIEPGLVESEFTLVRTGGDHAVHQTLYGGANPLQPEDIADTIFWVASLPSHVNVNSLEIMPVSQSFAGLQIHRHHADGLRADGTDVADG